MKPIFSCACLLSFFMVDLTSSSSSVGLLDVLDSFTQVMTGTDGKYNRKTFKHIIAAMWKFDPYMYESQNAAWEGLVKYYETNGGQGDHWGGSPSSYLERNTTLFPLPGGRSLLIFEPCNTASNFAYYHMVTSLARRRRWVMGRANTRALAQTCSALALGSAFFHGSHTRLGSRADNNLIGVMSFILHQASISKLPAQYRSPVITDLSMVRRNQTGVEMAQAITDLYRTRPNTEWLEYFRQLDIPDYYTTWAALIATLLTLLLPQSMVLPVALALASAFGVDDKSVQFLEREYIPQIKNALGKKNLSIFKKHKLFSHAMKMVKKMVFAFKFQEQTFPLEFLKSPLANQLGAFFQFPLNKLSELWTPLNKGISGSLLKGTGVYPGDSWCRSSQPHSLWHAQSAAALLDFFLLVDKMILSVFF